MQGTHSCQLQRTRDGEAPSRDQKSIRMLSSHYDQLDSVEIILFSAVRNGVEIRPGEFLPISVGRETARRRSTRVDFLLGMQRVCITGVVLGRRFVVMAPPTPPKSQQMPSRTCFCCTTRRVEIGCLRGLCEGRVGCVRYRLCGKTKSSPTARKSFL